jgi:DNA modification methylase
MKKDYKGLSGTFALNKIEPVHRWFSYMEGYSSVLVEREIEGIGYENIESIYDPFGGSGTSLLVAAEHGIKHYYSETNPVMAFICETKINGVKKAKENPEILYALEKIYVVVENIEFKYEDNKQFDGFEKYFDNNRLCEITQILFVIDECDCEVAKNIAKVAVAGITTQISEMVRQGDLRYAKGKEKEKVNQNVKEVFLKKLCDVISDIKSEEVCIHHQVILAAEDSRDIELNNEIDCVVTSPPYLNGTNYIRNTKLELKLLGFVNSEKDLPHWHEKGIIAGINGVSKRVGEIEILDCVRPYYEEILPVAYDKRIPIMIAGYFRDMNMVLKKLSIALKPGGIFIMDIGDSQFSGVHIPTHEILEKLATQCGFEKYDEEILRTRRSKNGMELSQRVLRFKLRK